MSAIQYRPQRPSALRRRVSSRSSGAVPTLATLKRTSLRFAKPTLTVDQQYDLARRRFRRELKGDERLVRLLGHATFLENLEHRDEEDEIEEVEQLSTVPGPGTPFDPPRASTARSREQKILDDIGEEDEEGGEKWEDLSDSSEDLSTDDEEEFADNNYFGTAIYRLHKHTSGEPSAPDDVPDLVDDSGSAPSSAPTSPEEETRLAIESMALPELADAKHPHSEVVPIEITQDG